MIDRFKKYHFDGQKPGEEILLVVRRHWFDIFLQLLFVFAMIFLLIASFTSIPALFPIMEKKSFNILFIFAESLFAMIIWVCFALIWVDYYFDVWIITNKRIVNILQNGLFNRDVSELELNRIQDITTEVIGIIPTFLNYGNIYIQTAGEKERFIFRNVPNPYGIKDMVMNLQKKQEQDESNELGEMIEKKVHEGINL